MAKRINITLPDKTIAVLNRVAPKGDRSRFISDAVLHLVETRDTQRLRERLKAGYLANAEDNLKIAADRFHVEEEAPQAAGVRARSKREKSLSA